MKSDQKKDNYLKSAATGRNGKTKRRAKIVRISIFVLLTLILCLLFLTLAFPHFLVKEISVKGANRYDKDELIALSGIKVGEEIFAVDLDHAISEILENCPYVRSASVTVHLSGKVVLNLTEEEEPMYTEDDGLFYSFSKSFSILEIKESSDEFSDFLYVELPVMTFLNGNTHVRFGADAEWAEKALPSLIEYLRKSSYGDKLTAVSVKNERGLFFILDGRCKVILGEAKDLEEKEERLMEWLKQKGGIPDTPTTVDLRDPKKIIEAPGI